MSARHLDLDELADHLAGEPGADEHLAGCADCTARLAELAAADRQVLATLRALPDPAVPPEVADRLHAALRSQPDRPTGPAATVTPLERARGPRRSWLPSVAAASALAFAGAVGYGLVTGAGAGKQDTATSSNAAGEAASEAAQEPLRTSATGTDYADPAAVPAALERVLSAGQAPTGQAPAAEPPPSGRSPGPGQDSASAAAPDPLARLRQPEALEECLAALLDPAQPGSRPLAVDYARYRGAPALAVVLPASPGQPRLSLYLVGPACSRDDAAVLLFRPVDPP